MEVTKRNKTLISEKLITAKTAEKGKRKQRNILKFRDTNLLEFKKYF